MARTQYRIDFNKFIKEIRKIYNKIDPIIVCCKNGYNTTIPSEVLSYLYDSILRDIISGKCQEIIPVLKFIEEWPKGKNPTFEDMVYIEFAERLICKRLERDIFWGCLPSFFRKEIMEYIDKSETQRSLLQ